MSNRPDLHTPQHDKWDQGGYCNNLVVDDDGCGTVCGYREPPEEPSASEAVVEAARAIRDHDAESLTCFDHDGTCCPCGKHDMSYAAWEFHRARAALFAALEAADQRATELAAVVEKVRACASSAAYGDGDYYSGYNSAQEDMLDILATAPADILREHDAALIEGLADKSLPDLTPGLSDDTTGSAVFTWLREKARQRREEQS